jgi:hypothetical protein
MITPSANIRRTIGGTGPLRADIARAGFVITAAAGGGAPSRDG